MISRLGLRIALPAVALLTAAGLSTPASTAQPTRADTTHEFGADLASGTPSRAGRELRQGRAQAVTITTGSRPTDANGDRLGSFVVKLPLSVPLHSDCSDPHFCFHWVSIGKHAPTDVQRARTKAAMIRSYRVEVDTLGFSAPRADAPRSDITGNPDDKIDIYFADLDRDEISSYCIPDRANAHVTSGHCVVDNDFAAWATTPAKASAVDAAYEVSQLNSMSYDALADGWLRDSTSQWMMDQVYPSIHHLAKSVGYSHLAAPFESPDWAPDPGPLTVDGTFGWPLLQYASDTYGPDFVRDVWERYPHATQGGVQAIRRTQAHFDIDQVRFAKRYALALTLQPGGFRDYKRYGKPVFAANRVLTPKRRTTTEWHLAHARSLATLPMRVVPGAGFPARQVLRIVLGRPGRFTAIARIQYADGHSTMMDLRPGSTTIKGFTASKIKSVVAVVVNYSALMKDCGTGLPWSCGGQAMVTGTPTLNLYAPKV